MGEAPRQPIFSYNQLSPDFSHLSFLLAKNHEHQLLYPPRNPLHQTRREPGSPAEALKRTQTAAARAQIGSREERHARNILDRLRKRTSEGPLSSGQFWPLAVGILQISVAPSSFVVHTCRQGGQVATRPHQSNTRPTSYPRERMESHDPWKQAAPSSWEPPLPFASGR